MTKTEKAVARYIKALDRRQKILTSIDVAYSRACDDAAAAGVALGNLDERLRATTYLEWQAKNQ